MSAVLAHLAPLHGARRDGRQRELRGGGREMFTAVAMATRSQNSLRGRPLRARVVEMAREKYKL